MNPDEFVLLNQSGPIIIGQGELPEFDASANAGLFVSAPRWPLLASAPATVVNGQRFRLAEAGREFGLEYLGRSVVELEAGENLSLPAIPFNPATNSLSIRVVFRDTVAGSTDYESIFAVANTIGTAFISFQVARTNGGNIYVQIQNTDNTAFLFGVTSKAITDSLYHSLELRFDPENQDVSMFVDDEFIQSWSTVGWMFGNASGFAMQPTEGFSPLQIPNVKISVDGALLDNIPCTEVSGTTLANLATPSRPATLSDANAHDLAWVPQDDVTMVVWQSRKSFNNSGIDLVHISSFPALEELYSANSPVTITTELTFNVDNVNAGVVVWGDTTSDYNLAIKQRTSNSLWCAINSGASAISDIAIQNGLFARLVASKSSSEASISCNGVSKTGSGSFAFNFANKGIYVGGHTDAENTEGCFHSVKIYSGYTATSDVSGLTLVDSIDFNDKSQWTGGASGTTKNGNPFTVTDGTPTGAYSSCWYPLSNQ